MGFIGPVLFLGYEQQVIDETKTLLHWIYLSKNLSDKELLSEEFLMELKFQVEKFDQTLEKYSLVLDLYNSK